MEVTLLGTGDTTGTPTVGCDCDTCTLARDRGIERSRFSVHVRNERTDESILIDASPDFRAQFLRQEVSLPDAAIITHIHFDHLDGLGNAFRLTRDLPVYAAGERDEVTGESVAETIERRYDYLDALEVASVDPHEPVSVCGFDVTLLPVEHPPLVSYGLVLEDAEGGGRLGLTGDTNANIPEESKTALAGVDLLLADAIVPAAFCEHHPAGGDHHGPDGTAHTFGTKHMTYEGAKALVSELDPGEHRLVHMSHWYPPDQAFEDELAVDGERFQL